MKVLFIVNPAAGKGLAARKVDSIHKAMDGIENVKYEIVYTERVGHARDLAEAGVDEGYDIIFAVGGDGTVNEVANGLINKNCAMAVIPGGSGNDYIRSLYVSGEVEDIIYEAINGDRKPIDVGLINGRHFVNISSVGFDADVVVAAKKAKKFFFSGTAAYLIGLITTILVRKKHTISMEIDSGTISDSILLVAVANGKYYGGGMKAAPDAILDDGLFDICFIKSVSRIKMLFLFPQFIKGKHKKIKEVSFYRSSKVHIKSEKPITVNVDGEIFIDNEVCMEIVKNGLTVAVPSAAELIR